jgi:hypothetical protein
MKVKYISVFFAYNSKQQREGLNHKGLPLSLYKIQQRVKSQILIDTILSVPLVNLYIVL